jgi:hypothetical protein
MLIVKEVIAFTKLGLVYATVDAAPNYNMYLVVSTEMVGYFFPLHQCISTCHIEVSDTTDSARPLTPLTH